MNKEKIILGKQYTLDMGQHVTVIPRRVLTEGIDCDYVMSSPGRKELIKFNIWEMNGFDVSDYSLMWMATEMDSERMKPEPKFKVGDSVLVCDDLKTEIIDIKYDNGEWRYYFKDENNYTKYENEYAIKLISKGELGIDAEEAIKEKMREQSPSQNIDTTQANINAINKSVDDINFNVESEAIRLTSSHYKLQRGLWEWTHGDKVEEDTWRMSKEHAKLTTEENIKQLVINNDIKKDDSLMNFWFEVIREIDKL